MGDAVKTKYVTGGGRHPEKALSAAFVRQVVIPGKYADGNGLYLLVQPNGAKSWMQRLTIAGKRHDIGLGGLSYVTLAEARERALENKRLARSGGNPLAEKRKTGEAMTFADGVEKFLAVKSAEFGNDKHRKQWRATLDTYAVPVLGGIALQAIEVRDVLRVLEPIWHNKTVTAKRVRQRIEAVLSWATVAGHRKGDNPARWGGSLAELLPSPSKIAKGDNHPALALGDVPRWWADLAKREGMAAKALQFLTLTVARSGEVRGMTWGEIEFEAPDKTDKTTAPRAIRAICAIPRAVWIVPASRMKAGREHRVPLTAEAVAILREVSGAAEDANWWERDPAALVFPAPRGGMLTDMTLLNAMRQIHESALAADLDAARAEGRTLADDAGGYRDRVNKRPAVPHGLRSTFRDWAADRGFDRDMAELALAHNVGDAVERAYRRSDMLERRRAMAEAWAQFIRGDTCTKNVAILRR